MIKIIKHSVISDFKAFIDNKLIYTHTDNDRFSEFLSSLYRFLVISYPKFFKMDMLSKLGFLATELCVAQTEFSKTENKINTAIYLLSNASSLDTDINYQKTLNPEAYFPSPKVFVYTLPNIVIGEIAIKHKIFGENTCFICQEFPDKTVFDYIYQSFLETDIKNAIVLWADYINGNGKAYAFLIERETSSNIDKDDFNEKTINFLIFNK